MEREPSTTCRPKRGAVGVDLGIKHLATLSDGTVIPNPRALDTRLKALRKAQQALSRKAMGSVRRGKAKERVARLYARVSDARMDAINKATTMIARTYSVVCIEDSNARGGDVRRADIVSGNADPSEMRTKQPPAGGVRLGAGLGNEAMRSRTN